MPDENPSGGLEVEPEQERGPPAAHHPTSQAVRRGGRSQDPEIVAAARRIRAAQLCAASVYACPAALAGYFFAGLVGVAVCGTVAVACGGLGLVGLSRAGPPPLDATDRPELVRFSARIAQTAPTKGVIGLIAGLLLFVGAVAILAMIVLVRGH